jgi:dienelactone hydrolase
MRVRRWLIVVVAGLLALSVLGRVPPLRTIAMTAVLVPELLGIRLLSTDAGEGEPQVESISYGTPRDRLDIWVPAGAHPGALLPGVVLALGVHPQPIDHPDIVRVAKAISRLGAVVGVPDSSALRELRVTADEPAHLGDAFLAIAARPEIDGGRVGLAGFSAGASMALVAASDPRIAPNVRFVSVFGGYADAQTLLVDVATRTTIGDGVVQEWRPDIGIRRDVLRLLVGTLADETERQQLDRLLLPVVEGDAPPAGPRDEDLVALMGDARAIYLLFTAADRPQAEAAVNGLSVHVREQLQGISPLAVADRIQSPVFLLHGVNDTAIPVAHADLLATALGDSVAKDTRFGSFGHEQPGLEGLGLDDASDVWELSLYLRDIVAATFE